MSRVRSAAASDSGLALVVALVVTLLVWLLTALVLFGAFHNALMSRRSWKRLTSATAAESGVDNYLEFLERSSTSLTSLQSGGGWSRPNAIAFPNRWERTISMPGQPVASVLQRAEYFADANLTSGINLTTLTAATLPARLWVRLSSIASSPSNCVVGAGHCVIRTMQAAIELLPNKQTLQGAFAGLYICELGQSITITGERADLYFLGSTGTGIGAACTGGNDLNITSGQFSTNGSVYVLNGGATLSANTLIKGDLYAKGAIALGSTTGTGCARNSPSKVLVCGNALSQQTITGDQVLGTRTPNCGAACGPSSITFPVVSSSAYTGTYSAPPSNLNTLTTLGVAGSTTTYQPASDASCSTPFSLDFKRRVTLVGNVTFVSRCGFTVTGPVQFKASSGTPTISFVTFYQIGSTTPSNCTALSAGVSTDKRDTRLSSISTDGVTSSSGPRIFAYTPCSLLVEQRVDIAGALVAGTAYLQNSTTINSVGFPLGGAGAIPTVAGFLQQVLWMREVR